MKVEIYSDVACPWCYIGEARFARALAAFPGEVEVVHRPFQLDPAAPSEAVPMLEYLEGRFGPGARSMAERVVETARGEGLAMDYDRGLAVNTIRAHRLLHVAEREGGPEAQRAVARGLFEAHFSRGLDVADPEVLTRVAAAAGLAPDRVRAYLDSDEDTAEVRAAIDGARRLGVTAVPTFVLDGRYGVQGAQPASVLLRALETVARETAGTAEPTADRDGDSCEEGACTG